jgi:hypothetical protein
VQVLVLNIESAIRACQRYLPLEEIDATAERADPAQENLAGFETARSEVTFCCRLFTQERTANGLASEHSLFESSETLEAAKSLQDTLDETLAWFCWAEATIEGLQRIPTFPVELKNRLSEGMIRLFDELYYPEWAAYSRSFGSRMCAGCSTADIGGKRPLKSEEVDDAFSLQDIPPWAVSLVVQFLQSLERTGGSDARRIPRETLGPLIEALRVLYEEPESSEDSSTSDCDGLHEAGNGVPDRACANGANGAKTSKLFPGGVPEDKQLVDLVVRLDAELPTGKNMSEIARDFTGESPENQKRAQSYLARIRRLRREGKISL